MTLGEALHNITSQLEAAHIITARLDALVLLEDIMEMGRASVLAHAETPLSASQEAALLARVTRRVQHEPLAYIRGKAEFYSRDFAVNAHVLVPRPETETIIEITKSLVLPEFPTIADIGTGSGCIGITAALEIPHVIVDLYDIDPQALEVADQNAEHLKAKVRTFESDLLTHLQGNYDVILANLPYVPEHYPINQAAMHEPKLALFAGIDGLRDYKTMFAQLAALTQKPLYVITESLPEQHHPLAQLARTHGYALEKTDDFIQLFQKN